MVKTNIKNMKLMMKVIGLAVLMSTLGHCNKFSLFKDDELYLEKTAYTGNDLRIDGYYFQEVNNMYYSVHFFYSNGLILYIGGGFNDMEDIEKNIQNEFLNNTYHKGYKDSWGVFNIEGTQIMFERWYPSDPPLKAYVRAGEILNDSTFVISESYRMKRGKKTEERDRNETYQFKAFSPKPDSTNNFVK